MNGIFQIDKVNDCWYEDGCESVLKPVKHDEQCWRLDIDDDIQVQLFATPIYEDGRQCADDFVPVYDDSGNAIINLYEQEEPKIIGWQDARLFIERDKRSVADNSVRVDYACKALKSVPGSWVIRVLSADLETAKKDELITQFVRDVRSMPCDFAFTGTTDEQYKKVEARILRNRDLPP